MELLLNLFWVMLGPRCPDLVAPSEDSLGIWDIPIISVPRCALIRPLDSPDTGIGLQERLV
jgi:hypothetical protein